MKLLAQGVKALQKVTDGQTDGRTDGRTDRRVLTLVPSALAAGTKNVTDFGSIFWDFPNPEELMRLWQIVWIRCIWKQSALCTSWQQNSHFYVSPLFNCFYGVQWWPFFFIIHTDDNSVLEVIVTTYSQNQFASDFIWFASCVNRNFILKYPICSP